MALFVDTAVIDEARTAAGLGFVTGATTNPTLLARAGHADHFAALQQLCALFRGTVFYQLTSRDLEGMHAEYQRFRPAGANLGLKIPCTLAGLQFAAQVAPEITVAITTVFHASQAYLAAEAGARYAIPYINRLTRLTGNGPAQAGEMAAVLRGQPCAVLAAGIKSAGEAVDTLRAGVPHLSLPLDVITSMAENSLSQQAIADFARA